MLVELDIQNFAIIKSLKVDFKDKMTVLIGETGAGKSILIDALSLLLGNRAQAEMIRTGQQKAKITGLFTVGKQKKELEELAANYGIPLEEDELIISREISSKGRNVVRINGQLTTISVLKEFGHYLVDIHGQNNQQILMNPKAQIYLVDDYADDNFKTTLKQYQENFYQWKKLTAEIKESEKNAQELAQRQDILNFQLNELESANLEDIHEDEILEEEFQELDNYQKIADTANYFMQMYDDPERGLATLLGQAQGAAEELGEYGKKFQNFAQSFNEGYYALGDARSELSNIMDSLDFDEERYHYVVERLDELKKLKKKYGPTLEDVFEFYARIQKEFKQFQASSDTESLKKEVAALEKLMEEQATNLHQSRQKIAHDLEKKIKQELADLYMEKAQFAIEVKSEAIFNKEGKDKITFLISPNPGEDLQPLIKVVSGGEQSRLVLALKSIFSKVEPVGTMIFDEIDTGVSGRVSGAIGKKMRAISQEKQVIAITHAPQVAAAADNYYQVAKKVENGATYTTISNLQEKDAVTVIAQMLAANEVTEVAKKNAEMLIKETHQGH
ncbi:DNA repair protein RecN [Lactobacillus sp. PV037]|uniref:DNA repair protein RecN n=1 Tax=Lactobacillus sp. PV037 TaxID=2594496 RepID=UPI00223F2EB5|nr:DNA repair protein RecN [Lactobacillus sp. PV037]QNQ83882.1 DNA repair protein RecN [Lactobacillus sp. PV037]